MSKSTKRMSWLSIIAYASPGLPTAMVRYGASLVIPGFYAAVHGLDVEAAGWAIIVTRLFDAASDLGAGYLSDRTRSRLGRRIPWIILGACLTTVAVAFLFQPSASPTIYYYTGWTLALFLGWTLVIVPHDAWGTELSRDYTQRSRIFTARAVTDYLGSILIVTSPQWLPNGNGEFDQPVLTANVWVIAGLFLVTVIVAIVASPKSEVTVVKTPSLQDLWRSVINNKPMKLYLVIYALSGLDLGIFLVMTYIFIVTYLDLGSSFSSILGVYILANFLFLPLWFLVIKKIGKHRAWAIGVMASGLCYPPLAFFTAENANLPIIMAVIAVAGACYTVNNVAERAVLGDIVDYDTLRTGDHRAANYFAIRSMIDKAGIALGGGIAYIVLGRIGYDPAAATNPADAVIGMKILYLFVPTSLKAIAVLLIWRFPIDKRRQGIVRARLEKREATTGA